MRNLVANILTVVTIFGAVSAQAKFCEGGKFEQAKAMSAIAALDLINVRSNDSSIEPKFLNQQFLQGGYAVMITISAESRIYDVIIEDPKACIITKVQLRK